MNRTANGQSAPADDVVRCALCEVGDGQTAEFYALLCAVEKKKTATEVPKPYFELVIRDRARQIKAKIWDNNRAVYEQCERRWKPGMHLWFQAKHDSKWNSMRSIQ